MAPRRSAEERREEIVEIAFRHFAEGGYHGTSTEAIAREARDLAAVPVPPVPDQARAVPGLRRALLRAASGRCSRRRPRRAAGGAADGDGRRVRGAAAARPPRAAVPDAGLRGRVEPEIQRRTCATASASSCGTWPTLAGVRLERDLGLLRLRDAAERGRRARSARSWPGRVGDAWASGRVIFRHRRAILVGLAGARAASPRCSRCRCSASSATTTTSTIRAPRRCRRASGSSTRRGRSRRRASSRSCGSARRSTRRRRSGGSARSARGAARSGRGVGRRLRAGRRPPARLQATAARPTCSRRSRQGRPGARARRSSSGSADVPYVDARRRRVRGAAGRRPGVGGHRARRADRVPDPASCSRCSCSAARSSALLPLAVGATTILLSFLAIRVVNQLNPMSIYALNLINGLGLGLAIDYSLFMVSRFREELARGTDREAALARDAAHRGARRSRSARSRSRPRWRR